MDYTRLVEATASGLRRMDEKPDYLLLIAQRFEGWEFDEDELCGIPVIKTHISVNSGVSGLDYPITPCFKSLAEEKIFMQVVRFQQGFENSAGSSF